MSARRSPTSRQIVDGRLRAARRIALVLASGFVLAGALPHAATAQAEPVAQAISADPFAAFIDEAATRSRLPTAWIRAVLRAESVGDPHAISRAGAMGLMQIMPSTWARLAARYALGANPFDPRTNILAGAAYLREMLDRFGDLVSALAAYNAGPGRVDAYRSTGRPLPIETIAYIARIAPNAGQTGGILPPRSAAPDPLAWRSASLFIAHDLAHPNSNLVASSTSAASTVSAVVAAENTPTAARPDQRQTARPGLFIPLSGQPHP